MNLGQVYTKPIVADYMVGLLDCDTKAKIIEPCFGMGVFIETLSRHNYTNVIGYEIDSNSYGKLQKTDYPEYLFYNADFFTLEDRDIDAIIMNPPYVRQEEIDDMELSRYACYLIVQNADPRKKVIALGQSYFAVKTRQQELIENFEQLDEDKKRLTND